MSVQPITASDIAGWESLEDIANTLAKRGLKPQPNLSEENTLVLQLADDEFITLIEAGPGESATDFKPHDVDRRHTNLVATNDYEDFTFLTRVRTFGQQHGQIKHQKLTFSKSQFTSDGGEKNTILQKLNEIEYGSSAAIYGDLYDTKRIVKAFYEQFEALRTDLVQEVTGIPDDRGDAKGRYVQVTLDRMIFLYFIQEKRLLDRNPDYLHEHHDRTVSEDGDVYEEFYRPLFFELLAEGKQDPKYGSLPYLNGGLFSTNPIEEEFPEARLGGSPEETNELFGRILSFLSNWNWNVDERLDIVDPKNLSPAVLGHIFEQTVNQKEMGAYYTPEEITGFMARRSIQPYLLDQLNEAVEAEYEEIDELFGLAGPQAGSNGETAVADGGTITQQAPTERVETEHVETLYFDVLQETRVLDPAVGSGAFLLAAQDVLLDVYLQCLEFFEQLYDENQLWSNRAREEIEKIQSGRGSTSLYAKRQIILHNLYGVDIDEGAVEICKLRLWLSMVADIEDEPSEVEPLPNIDFNIRQGNSLIGFTEVEEVARAEQGDASLANYGAVEGGVKELYEDVIDAIERHQEAISAEDATNARRLAESRIDLHSETLDEKVLEQYHEAGIDDVDTDDVTEFHPFHWVLEFAPVYRDGGFDIVIGNPPWDVLTPDRDHYFSKFDEIFRTRAPSDKDAKQKELLEDPEISEGWEDFQREMDIRAKYFQSSIAYSLQKPKIAGKTIGNNQIELSALFLERVFQIGGDHSHISQIVPGSIVSGATQKDLRLHLLEETEVDSIIGFENHGIFDQLHNQYKFAIVTFRNSGETQSLRGIFQQRSVKTLANFEEIAVQLSRSVLKNFSPNAAVFPYVKSQREAEALDSILSHPSVDFDIEESWKIEPYSEIHRSKDSNLLFEDESDGYYPIFEGKNIHQFQYDPSFTELADTSLWGVSAERDPARSAKQRIRKKELRNLKRGIYYSLGGEKTSKSQKQFVNDLLEAQRGEPLSEEDVLLDSTEYRLVIREVTNSTNERTVVAAAIQKGAICVHTLHTVRPYQLNPTEEDLKEKPLHEAYDRVFSDEDLFVALGLLNSIPFDFLMRMKVDSHIVMYKLKESQMPRLTDGDDWFHYISSRAARLNCYGDQFEEMRDRLGGIDPATGNQERRELQAEIDAAAFHAYGLGRDDTEFVLDDFHRVENPRLMDEPYFEMVLEKYDELADEGPKP